MGRTRKAGLVLGALAAQVAIVLALPVSLAVIQDRGARVDPSPLGAPSPSDDGFPAVDWDYWNGENQDVIGWISIPGTGIDHPIAQAPAGDPQWYLSHDVFGLWNPIGCPYLDADCAQGGLLGPGNAVVSGHNMGWNRQMFGDLPLFADDAFARSHRRVLVQTPDGKADYRVVSVRTIPGWETAKRTAFGGPEEYSAWLAEQCGESDIDLPPPSADAPRSLTLCTCSYGQGEPGRTVVLCVPAEYT